jgi:phosphoribosylformylglycinamidine synthase
LGIKLHLDKVPLGEPVDRNDAILFSESNTRFLVEVAPEESQRFEEAMGGVELAVIGEVTEGDKFEVYGLSEEKLISVSLAELKEAWQKPLGW